MKRLLPDFIILLILLLLPLGFFWQQTVGGKTLIPTENVYQYEPYATYQDVVKAPKVPHNHLVSDLILENYQWKWFIRQQLSIGEIPLWNPYQFSGIPFLAAGQHSALYPLSALYYGLDLPIAYGWFTVINLWLAGVMMFGFMRALNIGRAGALLAGIVYQLGGFVLASVVFQMMIGGLVWLPLLLWMAERIIHRETNPLPSVVVGALALGLNILAGHAEITIYTLVIVGYYSGLRLLWQAVQAKSARLFFIKGVWLSLMVVLGIGLGAVQLLPLFDFVRSNWRAERASLATVLSYAHPLRDLVQFIMPNFYGNPTHHQYLDVFSGQIVRDFVNGSRTPYIDWGIKNYVEGALYLGILPLILSAFALLPKRWLGISDEKTPPYRAIFASLGALSLTFMFGLPTYAMVYALPGINQLNSPFRWIYALTVCVAILSAFGMEHLSRTTHPKFSRRLGIGLVGLGGVVLAGLLFSRLFFEQVEPWVTRLFTSMAKAPDAFADARMFYSYEFVNVLIFGTVLTLCGIVLAWSSQPTAHNDARWGGIRPWQVFALILVSVDLMIATWDFNPASDPALLDFTPPSIQWLQNQRLNEAFRYITLDDPSQRPILQANSTWRFGLEDVRGYDSIIPKTYVEYMNRIAPPVQLDFNRIAPLYTVYPESVAFDVQNALDNPLLWMLNVRYVVSHRNVDLTSEQYQLVYEDEAVKIWQVVHTLPRLWVCCDANAPETPNLLRWLASGEVLPAELWTAVLSDLERDDTPTNDSMPILRQDSGREKLIDVTTTADSWLVLSEQYNDGWRAFIRPLGADESQETPLSLQRVNGILQGIQLPTGAWTVRVVYSPSSFQLGVFGSIMSVATLMLMVGMGLWRSFVGVNTESSSTSARVVRNSVAPIVLNLFNRGIDFAFLLVMLRLLTPQDVGTYNYLVVVFVWFDIFTNFGLNLFLIREVSRDKSQAGTLFYNSSVLRLGLVIASVLLLLGYIGLRQTTVTPALDMQALMTLGLLYLGLLPGTLNQGISALFYAFEQAEKPSAIATITTLNKAVFGVVVLLLGWGIVGLALVSVFNNVLTLIVLLVTGRTLIGTGIPWRPDATLIRRMVRGSWALLLNNFLATIFFQIDVVILEAYKGAEIVAKYSVSYKWLLAINIIPSFFTQALLPIMSRQAHEDPNALKRTYTFGVKLLFALALPLAVVFTALSVPLTTFMGGVQYLPDGAIALIIMIWSIPIGWMNSLTQYALVALDLQRRITIAFFCAVAFNIGLNMLLIPQYSYIAAAITTIASEGVLWLAFALMMNVGLKSRIAWGSLLWRPVVATLSMAGGVILLTPVHSLLALIGGSLIYAVVLIALKPFNTDERAMFNRILPRRIAPIAQKLGIA